MKDTLLPMWHKILLFPQPLSSDSEADEAVHGDCAVCQKWIEDNIFWPSVKRQALAAKYKGGYRIVPFHVLSMPSDYKPNPAYHSPKNRV